MWMFCMIPTEVYIIYYRYIQFYVSVYFSLFYRVSGQRCVLYIIHSSTLEIFEGILTIEVSHFR